MLYRDPRSQISSILETNRTVDGTRVNVTREIHRNYIGIRVLIRVSRVNDVHEDFHSRRIKLNINFKGERKKKKKNFSRVLQRVRHEILSRI